jgi:hypothetical protein
VSLRAAFSLSIERALRDGSLSRKRRIAFDVAAASELRFGQRLLRVRLSEPLRTVADRSRITPRPFGPWILPDTCVGVGIRRPAAVLVGSHNRRAWRSVVAALALDRCGGVVLSQCAPARVSLYERRHNHERE